MSLSFFQKVRFFNVALVMTAFVSICAPQSFAQRIVFIGDPGSGKGTHAGPLSALNGTPIISGSEIVGKLSKADPVFGATAQEMRKRGELLPDTPEYMGRVLETLANRIAEPDCSMGYNLDGIPRTLWQASELNRILAARGQRIDAVIWLQVKRETILERLAGRKVCPTCSKSYHNKFKPPVKEGFCNDPCGCALVTRADDSDEAVAVRLAIYDREMGPVIDYYRNLGLLVPIDGNGNAADVFESIKVALKAKGL